MKSSSRAIPSSDKPITSAAPSEAYEPCDYCGLTICGPENYSHVAGAFICAPCVETILEGKTHAA